MNIQNDRIASDSGIWIALAHVMPSSDMTVLEGARGAYVNVACPAISSEQLANQVRSQLAKIGLTLVDLEDISEYRSVDVGEGNEFRELYERVRWSGRMELGAFHTYQDSDDVN